MFGSALREHGISKQRLQEQRPHENWQTQDPCPCLAQILQHAAEHTLTRVHPAPKKDYISAQTWKCIEEKEVKNRRRKMGNMIEVRPCHPKENGPQRSCMMIEQQQLTTKDIFLGWPAARKTFQRRSKFKNAKRQVK